MIQGNNTCICEHNVMIIHIGQYVQYVKVNQLIQGDNTCVWEHSIVLGGDQGSKAPLFVRAKMVNQITMCLIVQGDNTCVWGRSIAHGLDQGSKAFVFVDSSKGLKFLFLLIQAIVK